MFGAHIPYKYCELRGPRAGRWLGHGLITILLEAYAGYTRVHQPYRRFVYQLTIASPTTQSRVIAPAFPLISLLNISTGSLRDKAFAVTRVSGQAVHASLISCWNIEQELLHTI